jgi:phytol kinase
LTVLGLAEVWRHWGHPKPEWTRKLVHLGGGITCLFFPFLVESPWVVLALTVGMSALFAGAARFGFLQSLHGVERTSRGAEYYPLAIFLVFVLSRGRPWLYVAAVLVLAVADAFAALIGSRYGRVHYQTERGEKSLEGSLVFFVTAFLAIHLPMLLLTDLPRETTVLAALLVAFLVTGFEAISLRGTDNLFVPVAVVFILGKITTKPVSEVVYQNLSLLAICIVVAILAWRIPAFNTGAAIAMILFVYANWSLGSWQWALPVLAGLVCYLVAWVTIPERTPEIQIRIRAISRALVPLFLILILANATRAWDLLYGPYVFATAGVLAFSLAGPILNLRRLSRGLRPAAVAATAIVATLVTSLPPWLLQGRAHALQLPVGALVVFVVTWIITLLDARPGVVLGGWTASRILGTWIVLGLVLLAQAVGWVPLWHPG